jgi:hypothetical protein
MGCMGGLGFKVLFTALQNHRFYCHKTWYLQSGLTSVDYKIVHRRWLTLRIQTTKFLKEQGTMKQYKVPSIDQSLGVKSMVHLRISSTSPRTTQLKIQEKKLEFNAGCQCTHR